jgi:integrase
MVDIILIQVLTTRRISETMRLKWGDVNHEDRTCIVRDLKDPKRKKGNDAVFPLLGKAWDLVMEQPRLTNDPNERIFPYNHRTVIAKFVEAKKDLGIKNLHLHDLRREGASRLFEAGYDVQEVMMMTLHKTPIMLLRVYTKLKPADMHLGPAKRRGLVSENANANA